MTAPSQTTAISQACTVGTTHTLATISSASRKSVFPAIPAAATAADIFEFSLWIKVASGDTSAQFGPTITVPGTGVLFYVDLGTLPVVTELLVKVKQSAGTGRTVIGSVVDVG